MPFKKAINLSKLAPHYARLHVLLLGRYALRFLNTGVLDLTIAEAPPPEKDLLWHKTWHESLEEVTPSQKQDPTFYRTYIDEFSRLFPTFFNHAWTEMHDSYDGKEPKSNNITAHIAGKRMAEALVWHLLPEIEREFEIKCPSYKKEIKKQTHRLKRLQKFYAHHTCHEDAASREFQTSFRHGFLTSFSNSLDENIGYQVLKKVLDPLPIPDPSYVIRIDPPNQFLSAPTQSTSQPPSSDPPPPQSWSRFKGYVELTFPNWDYVKKNIGRNLPS